jgi:hypothetical protein
LAAESSYGEFGIVLEMVWLEMVWLEMVWLETVSLEIVSTTEPAIFRRPVPSG